MFSSDFSGSAGLPGSVIFLPKLPLKREISAISDVLFAPHHGRDSGRVPSQWLNTIDPYIVVIGEAPSGNINYYQGYNTITQNSAGDITFECDTGKVHVFVSSSSYSVDFLYNDNKVSLPGYHYLGTFNTKN